MAELFASFVALPNAATSSDYEAIPISRRRRDFLGKAADGAPVFLLHDASDPKYNPSVNFRHLSAQFHVRCRVQTEHGRLEDQFCLVSCDSAAPELYELFVRCVSAAVEEMPASCGTKELESCILELRNLFRALASPSAREISGLWAELFVILRSGSPERAVALWHADQFDRFDFSSSRLHLEVKSTVKAIRAHEFSLEQLQPPSVGLGLVASVMLQPLSNGIGVLDLARSVDAAIIGMPRLRQKLWENVALTLGADFSDKLDKRFDLSYGDRGFAIYAMNDIPKLEEPTDPRVTAIHFVADLTGVLPADSSISPTEVLHTALTDVGTIGSR